MSQSSTTATAIQPEFDTLWGHPKPLWMLFMAEFWERFAFYGIRWALTLYIVAQFFGGDAGGEGAERGAECLWVKALLRRHVVSRGTGGKMASSMKFAIGRVIVPTD